MRDTPTASATVARVAGRLRSERFRGVICIGKDYTGKAMRPSSRGCGARASSLAHHAPDGAYREARGHHARDHHLPGAPRERADPAALVAEPARVRHADRERPGDQRRPVPARGRRLRVGRPPALEPRAVGGLGRPRGDARGRARRRDRRLLRAADRQRPQREDPDLRPATGVPRARPGRPRAGGRADPRPRAAPARLAHHQHAGRAARAGQLPRPRDAPVPHRRRRRQLSDGERRAGIRPGRVEVGHVQASTFVPRDVLDVATEAALAAGRRAAAPLRRPAPRAGRQAGARRSRLRRGPRRRAGDRRRARRAAAPTTACSGEEGTANRDGTTGLRWVVDPLDGTVNYLLGDPAVVREHRLRGRRRDARRRRLRPAARRSCSRPCAAARCAPTAAARGRASTPSSRPP